MAAIGLALLLVLVGAPLMGWPPLVRLPAVLVPALAVTLVVTRPWRWREWDRRALAWQPSVRQVWAAALVVGLMLFWYVVTRFKSGEINAVDFTVYFDRPCFQAAQGRPMFVEVSDTPGFSHRNESGAPCTPCASCASLARVERLRARPRWPSSSTTTPRAR